MLILQTALATELTTHRYDQRVELGTLGAGDTPFVLVLGPCDTPTCPLVLERGDAHHTVATVEREGSTWASGALKEDGMLVQLGEQQQLTVELLPVEDLVPMPAVLVHSIQGWDHLRDVRELIVAETSGLRSVWSGHLMPRELGFTTVRFLRLDGRTTLVQEYVLPIGIQSETHATAVVEGWRWEQGKLVEVPDLPAWAAIAGLVGAPRNGRGCLVEFPVLSTDDWPRLAPGLSIRGWVTADRAEAQRRVEQARACVPDAYVKRAR